MAKISKQQIEIRLHATNVTGIGAYQLVSNLIPAIENNDSAIISEIYVGENGSLSDYSPLRSHTRLTKYSRNLSNAISRFLECTIFAKEFSGSGTLIVLGDIPLRCKGKQIVLVHTPHLCSPNMYLFKTFNIKAFISSLLFKLNKNRVTKFVVQTNQMQSNLSKKYSIDKSKISIIPQPVPKWLHDGKMKNSYVTKKAYSVKLFYPAANYPHKNHKLLSLLDYKTQKVIKNITITLDSHNSPMGQHEYIKCVGHLKPPEMLEEYNKADALLFLSTAESYGFPLIEAMYLGLPIVCPDLPYAREICGNQALYFDPNCPKSLMEAITSLQQKIINGWCPDWRKQLQKIPNSWDITAIKFIDLCEDNKTNKTKAGKYE